MSTPVIHLQHFSDVLCVWAYIAQVRMDELQQEFGEAVELDYHFLSVFGATESGIARNWADRGGFQAYNHHVLQLAQQFPHVDLHEDIWLKNRPASSSACHLYLKAIQLLEKEQGMENNQWLAAYAWAMRLAFFRELRDIGSLEVQNQLAEALALPVERIVQKLQNGQAHAALEQDYQLKSEYRISGSPTLIFNEGRQVIYGNVGYRVIEANIKELLHKPGHQASWC